MSNPYKGRFAPTPSGPAHLGTLLAAVGSFLQARANRGEWHIRVDDIDPPREVTGSADSILKTLQDYGLHWDSDVVYQSQRLNHYQQALDLLIEQGATYDCGCSRKEIDKIAKTGPNGAIYPGTCRTGLPEGKTARAVRLRTKDQPITLPDRIQGDYVLNVGHEVGDFILRRADGLFSYHLATVVDDALDGFTEIVRGQDLLSITPQQIHLQQALELPTPAYAHLPMLVDEEGKKLCKRFGAQAVDEMDKAEVLETIFMALGLPQQPDILHAPDEERWQWAIECWDIRQVPAS